MIHRLRLGVASDDALEFWDPATARSRLRSRTRAELAAIHRLRRPRAGAGRSAPTATRRCSAEHPEIPPEHAIVGIEGARAYTTRGAVAEAESLLTQTLGFTDQGGGEYRLDGEQRHVHWAYDPAPEEPGIQGAGTVHHIAWACPDADQPAWQQRVRRAGRHVTDVLDRDYFKSIYFREPRGVLFEIATLSPGFAVDEDLEHLGEQLRLPRQHEHLRPQLERLLTPVQNPGWSAGSPSARE